MSTSSTQIVYTGLNSATMSIPPADMAKTFLGTTTGFHRLKLQETGKAPVPFTWNHVRSLSNAADRENINAFRNQYIKQIKDSLCLPDGCTLSMVGTFDQATLGSQVDSDIDINIQFQDTVTVKGFWSAKKISVNPGHKVEAMFKLIQKQHAAHFPSATLATMFDTNFYASLVDKKGDLYDYQRMFEECAPPGTCLKQHAYAFLRVCEALDSGAILSKFDRDTIQPILREAYSILEIGSTEPIQQIEEAWKKLDTNGESKSRGYIQFVIAELYPLLSEHKGESNDELVDMIFSGEKTPQVSKEHIKAALDVMNKPAEREYDHYITYVQTFLEKARSVNCAGIHDAYSQVKMQENETYRSLGGYLHVVLNIPKLPPQMYLDSILDNLGFFYGYLPKEEPVPPGEATDLPKTKEEPVPPEEEANEKEGGNGDTNEQFLTISKIAKYVSRMIDAFERIQSDREACEATLAKLKILVGLVNNHRKHKCEDIEKQIINEFFLENFKLNAIEDVIIKNIVNPALKAVMCQEEEEVQRGGGKGPLYMYILNRRRKLTKIGRSWTLLYKGKRIKLAEAKRIRV